MTTKELIAYTSLIAVVPSTLGFKENVYGELVYLGQPVPIATLFIMAAVQFVVLVWSIRVVMEGTPRGE